MPCAGSSHRDSEPGVTKQTIAQLQQGGCVLADAAVCSHGGSTLQPFRADASKALRLRPAITERNCDNTVVLTRLDEDGQPQFTRSA